MPRRKIKELPDASSKIEGETKNSYYLTNDQRTAVQRKTLAAQAAMLILNSDKAMKEIGNELNIDPKEIVMMATQEHQPEVREALMRRLAGMFLEVSRHVDRAEMCEKMGITRMQLAYLLKTDEFKAIWTEMFAGLEADPIIPAVQAAITENLLPKSLRALDDIITNSPSDNAKLRAALAIMKLAGIQPQTPVQSDREQGALFLQQFNIQIVNGEVPKLDVPPEYRRAMDEVNEIINGDFVEDESGD